ncbi:MAG: phenylalanine--tRNA ligase subunit alpha [Dehalococcoidia bacterium]|nr:phenylalanine--tRNA ligase subunit alpha [Dehalococcoidia bacterium]
MPDIKQQISELRASALKELDGLSQAKELEEWRIGYLGKKSRLTELLRSLASLPIEERRELGQASNVLKTELEAVFKNKEHQLRCGELVAAGEMMDVTLPGRPFPAGHLHPVSQVLSEISDIFAGMGFQVVEGPEVEWDSYNFDALNIPPEHPSRDNMATFWLDSPPKEPEGWRMLLRTHTSPMQVRTMEQVAPPVRIVVPGRVFRYEATDATHLAMFTQIEGLAVDRGISMADLKGTLFEFARRFFGADRAVRFRTDFFPFVEPGAEMAIECAVCRGGGCRLCGGSGWIEILGAGMVHPRVLERAGIDSTVYSGFAFGIGIERIPMLHYGIDDIRLFYSGDLRFLKQF